MLTENTTEYHPNGYIALCIICNFWSYDFRNNVSIFQEHSKKTKIQEYILAIS